MSLPFDSTQPSAPTHPKHYVLGLAFTPSMEHMLVVHKEHPEWQKGKINGIGGKVEETESPVEALVRECQEEANFNTDPSQWNYMGRIDGPLFCVDVFRGVFLEHDFEYIQSLTDEEIELMPVDYDVLAHRGLYNLLSFIHMAKIHEPIHLHLKYLA